MEKNRCPKCAKLKDSSYKYCWDCGQEKIEKDQDIITNLAIAEVAAIIIQKKDATHETFDSWFNHIKSKVRGA